MARSSRGAIYDDVISEVFRKLRAEQPTAEFMDFKKADIEDAIRELGVTVRNVPDIKYTYDARSPFPAAIQDTGHWAIVGRGKGLYTFALLQHYNLIRLPESVGHLHFMVETVIDETPAPVRKVLGDDEQATLTRIYENRIIERFTGLNAWKVQGHERLSIPEVGQMEIDEVYIGQDDDEVDYVIPISAKGGNDCLSFTQAFNLNMYAAKDKKGRYNRLKARPLGISRTPDGHIHILEFSGHLDIRKIEIVKAACYDLRDPD